MDSVLSLYPKPHDYLYAALVLYTLYIDYFSGHSGLQESPVPLSWTSRLSFLTVDWHNNYF